MVAQKLSGEEIDKIFHALADGTRRDIVTRVYQREQSITDLASAYPMSFAAVQKHVAVLERASLVHKQRSGREQVVRGDPGSLRAVERLLAEYERLWSGRIDRMTALLAPREAVQASTSTSTSTSTPAKPRRKNSDKGESDDRD